LPEDRSATLRGITPRRPGPLFRSAPTPHSGSWRRTAASACIGLVHSEVRQRDHAAARCGTTRMRFVLSYARLPSRHAKCSSGRGGPSSRARKAHSCSPWCCSSPARATRAKLPGQRNAKQRVGSACSAVPGARIRVPRTETRTAIPVAPSAACQTSAPPSPFRRRTTIRHAKPIRTALPSPREILAFRAASVAPPTQPSTPALSRSTVRTSPTRRRSSAPRTEDASTRAGRCLGEVMSGRSAAAAPVKGGSCHGADASTDACAPSGCTGSCVNLSAHDVSTMSNGCLVWQCCVPDDADANTE
jgi:hypothetical protein